MSTHPAILDGSPVFDQRINIVRPVLPQLHELQSEIEAILQSGMVTKGIHLKQLEAKMAEYLQVEHAIAVSSCTAGLILVLRGLGLKSGEVIVPSFTFMATVAACVWAGMRPVFADVDIGTTNLMPEAAERAITPETRAIMAVHNFGNPAAIDALEQIADKHGLKLIFDAAHGFGSLHNGRPIGAFGAAEVFSLSPTKLVIAGEGGIVATNNENLAQQIRLGREYGMTDYNSQFAGLSARLPEFSAVMAIHSLRLVEDAVQHRNQLAALYERQLSCLPGIQFQTVDSTNRCSYKDYSIVIHDEFGLTADELVIALNAENIDVRRYYNPPVHRQTAYRQYVKSDQRLPTTDMLAHRSVSLPIWSNMEHHICLRIADAIKSIHEYAIPIRKTLHRAKASA